MNDAAGIMFLSAIPTKARSASRLSWNRWKKRVDGLVLCSSRLQDEPLRAALEHHPAVVLVNRRLAGAPVGVIMLADDAGARSAVEHLLHSGHTAVGFLAGPLTSYSSRQRTRGYEAAMQAAGIFHNLDWVRPCSYEVRAEKTARALLDHPELTALFCYNDLSPLAPCRPAPIWAAGCRATWRLLALTTFRWLRWSHPR